VSDDSCVNILPVADWIKREGKICRPCVLPVLVSWYVSELEETGNRDLSIRIKQLVEDPNLTPEQTASELDNIKTLVKDPKLAARLREFDCSIQKNE